MPMVPSWPGSQCLQHFINKRSLTQVFVQAESTGETVASWLNDYRFNLLIFACQKTLQVPVLPADQPTAAAKSPKAWMLKLHAHAELGLILALRPKPPTCRTFFLPLTCLPWLDHMKFNQKTVRKVRHAKFHG